MRLRSAMRRVGGGGQRLAGVALTIVVGYLALLTVAAWRAVLARPARDARGVPCGGRRFVVLVPAHDEEQLIGATLASLQRLDYPTDRYAVHVVADNCTDSTAAIVTRLGVEVHERTDPNRPGKGPALDWLIDRLRRRDEPFDALVFVDADTTVDAGFLSAVDRALASGAQVVQAHYAVRDAAASPIVAFRAAAFAARNFLRPLGRVRIGGTAGLYGNGMVFDRGVLVGRTWSDHLTEDAELQLELLLDGTLVAFAPAARVEAEMPTTLEASRTQHERWEQGRLQLAKRYVPTLLRRTVGGGPSPRRAYLDATLDQLVPPFSVVVAGTAAWTALAGVQLLMTGGRSGRRQVGLGVTLGAAQTAYVLSALRMVKAEPAVYRALLSAPKVVLWKLGLWTRVLAKPRDVGWIRTARNPGT